MIKEEKDVNFEEIASTNEQFAKYLEISKKWVCKEKYKYSILLHWLWLGNITGGKRAKLNRAELNRANLNGAELNNAKLNGAELNNAKLNRAELNRAELNCTSVILFVQFPCLYKYSSHLRINKDSSIEIRLGCHTRALEEWENDFWNNDREFPNDGSMESNKRLKAFEFIKATAKLYLEK